MLSGFRRSALSGIDNVSSRDRVMYSDTYLRETYRDYRSQAWRNVLASSGRNATVSIGSSVDPRVPDKRHLEQGSSRWQHNRPQWRRGMPSKGRATLFGHFELTNATTHPVLSRKFSHCYLHHHPDASHWSPGSKASPHVPFWATFVVNRVYWVGGFGDEHFIGWFNQSEWNTAWKASPGIPPETYFIAEKTLDDRTVSNYQELFGIPDPDRMPPPQLVFQ